MLNMIHICNHISSIINFTILYIHCRKCGLFRIEICVISFFLVKCFFFILFYLLVCLMYMHVCDKFKNKYHKLIYHIFFLFLSPFHTIKHIFDFMHSVRHYKFIVAIGYIILVVLSIFFLPANLKLLYPIFFSLFTFSSLHPILFSLSVYEYTPILLILLQSISFSAFHQNIKISFSSCISVCNMLLCN